MPSKNGPRRKHDHIPKSSHNSFRAEPWLNSLPSSKADFFRLITVVSIAVAVAVACNFVATSINHQPKPFCDTDDFSLSDRCEPCPENGLCKYGKLECGHGYRKHGKVCVEDGDISEAAKKISKWAEVRVCEAYAQFLCSGIGGCWVGEDELWNKLSEDQTSDDDKLDGVSHAFARKRAKETIHKLLETRRNSQGIVEFKCPESIVYGYKPLSCRARQWMVKNALLLVPACALFMGGIIIASRIYRRRILSARAEQVYHEVCDILEERPLMSRNENDGGEPPWVAASWLRDHLLSPKERKDMVLWRKVEELVQEDSRVDQYPKLVKGESKVVWEWQVEGSLSASRKRRRESQPELKENVTSSFNAQTKTRAVEPLLVNYVNL
ncbi:hypothetical protein F511_07573 [Dorcoceras hygrometricum]|uniref:Man1/Src1-like C-terminal domain-containing protein n=1 Tax=Dorcoceras hygrometricum TaxID=472368 RepID=A0A2Z7D4L1_9LAMI|nr:hypothetical protein F511_07573 [Dorcoceras hygrometricum]